jgi:anti-repressor protein
MAMGNAATDSLKVAKGFGKRHDAVLRAIANLDCSPEFRQHNFVAANYTDVR